MACEEDGDMNFSKPKAVICDLDGTLVDISSIRHLVERQKPDFDAFHRLSVDCPPRGEVLACLEDYRSRGLVALIVSARSEKFMKLTNMWLALNEIECAELLLRGLRDSRADILVKTSMYHRLASKYEIVAALDDRSQLIQNWTDLGIPVVHDFSETVEVSLAPESRRS